MPKNNAEDPVRLDKWLWANGVKAKPSRTVEVGALVKVLQGNIRIEVEVLKISDVRGPATVARTLYQETEESIVKREKQLEQLKINALLAPHPDEKPNKKDRRTLISMKYGQ